MVSQVIGYVLDRCRAAEATLEIVALLASPHLDEDSYRALGADCVW